MDIEQFKTIAGDKYQITVKGEVYTWQLLNKAPIVLSFTTGGAYINGMGSIPDQIHQLSHNKTLSLTQAQQILGVGRVSGRVYGISLSDNILIKISTDMDGKMYSYEANTYCPRLGRF